MRTASPSSLIVNGMTGVALAYVLWKLTASLIGWAALFLPGAALILAGTVLIFCETL